MSGYAYTTDLLYDEMRELVEQAVGSINLPQQPTDARPDPPDAPLTIYAGIPESTAGDLAWPLCVINADSGRSGSVKTGDDMRAVMRLTLGIYLREPQDYIWLERLCELLCRALLPYGRVTGRSITLDQKEQVIRWQSIDEIEFPLAAAQMLCEVRIPGGEEIITP